MKPIDHNDMVVIADTFIGAYGHVIKNMPSETQQLAKRFTGELVGRVIPTMMVTPAGVANVQQLVFGREENRDFILMLTHVLFARLGGDDEMVEALARNLARGISVPGKTDMVMMPEDVVLRLSKFDDVVDVLKNNLWLLTILLMQLFISLDLAEEGKK